MIGAIYESRPNVTVDISVLCLKAGNAVILRGGKEAYRSNLALANTVQEAAYKAGIPAGAVQFIESTDRGLVDNMLRLKDSIDLMIPRGGAALIKFVKDNAAMAVVAGGIGVCHAYVDKTADIAKAIAITYNAKVQRPTVCNACWTACWCTRTSPPLSCPKWRRNGIKRESRCTATSAPWKYSNRYTD